MHSPVCAAVLMYCVLTLYTHFIVIQGQAVFSKSCKLKVLPLFLTDRADCVMDHFTQDDKAQGRLTHIQLSLHVGSAEEYAEIFPLSPHYML